MTEQGTIAALVVAAGGGSRMGGAIPKQYRELNGQTVLAYAIDHLRHPRIDHIQVVIGPEQDRLYRDAIGSRPLPPPIIGGATRQQSVRNGLEAFAGRPDVQAVLIHDAARPFLPPLIVDRLVEALADAEGAVPVLPVADSLALAGERLGEAIAREQMVRVQTPQAFRFRTILAAHQAWTGALDATDDAQVARAAGAHIAMVAGDEDLAKLTFPQDFDRAARRLQAGTTSHVGFGFDVHAFNDGDHLWLGGIRIAHDRGLSGHSDADVALHALTDALLGACGEGDIGDHFPPSDPQWHGAASSGFVEHARTLIDGRGGKIDHVDLTIICEAPRLTTHKAAIRQRIAELLNLPLGRVSIKATTTERLGFTGRGEGIAAQAVATIRMADGQ